MPTVSQNSSPRQEIGRPRTYRILIFAPAFAPFANPEAIVNSKLALAMLDAGWEIDVISRCLAGQSTYDYGSGWDAACAPLGSITHELPLGTGGVARRWWSTFQAFLAVRYPVAGMKWAAAAMRLGRLLHRRNAYDAVLSRAFPSSAHLAAMRFAQCAKIPWIANWNDPWEFMRRGGASDELENQLRRIDARFARCVARTASWHTFPSDQLRQRMCDYLQGGADRRSSTIPHAAMLQPLPADIPERSEFQICYTGQITVDHRPEAFLRGFRRFVQSLSDPSIVKFVFVGLDRAGMCEQIARLGLQPYFHFAGSLGYSATLARAARSTISLLIDPPEAGGMLLQSKFVDYVSIGRPILAVTSSASTVGEILRREGGGIVANCGDEQDIARALRTLFDAWSQGSLDQHFGSRRLYPKYSPDSIIRLYQDIFATLVGRRQGGAA
jgi:glycosyltransferase involved in cell wall biosynthesis